MWLFRKASAVVVVLLLCTLMVAAPAIAAPPKDAVKPSREFNFETDEVMVDVLKPDSLMVEVLRAKARKSLIKIRMDFIKEIVRSAEDI